MSIFEEILAVRSLTLITYMVEDAFNDKEAPPLNVQDTAALHAICEARGLDETYILCHEHLARTHLEKAAQIREFIEKKNGKKS